MRARRWTAAAGALVLTAALAKLADPVRFVRRAPMVGSHRP